MARRSNVAESRPLPRREPSAAPRPETARELALRALSRIEHEGAFANIALPVMLDRSRLSEQDRRFVTDLVYGTTRMRRACDSLIDRFVVSEPDDATRSLLRLGAYQLAFGGVPPHAAVSATVDLAPRKTSGFVNAILRKVGRAVSDGVISWPSDAVRLSYPDWVVERYAREAGDEAMSSLETMNRPARVTRRDDGYVQDVSSQWVADAVGARVGESVLDVCAGPGGKATAMCTSGALVVGADRQSHRARLVSRNAESLGHRVPVVVADGTRPPFADESFDRVLVDAPCSGLGALRRRADARWRISESDIDDLVRLQAAIIGASARLVRPGGVLVYSVCTITAAESIEHAIPAGFAPVGRDGDDVLPALTADWHDFGHGHRVLPRNLETHGVDSDGMVILRYRRTV